MPCCIQPRFTWLPKKLSILVEIQSEEKCCLLLAQEAEPQSAGQGEQMWHSSKVTKGKQSCSALPGNPCTYAELLFHTKSRGTQHIL